MSDAINPSHYKQGSIECIEAMEQILTPEEFRGYLKGNVFKYLWRERKKKGIEDLRKAKWYLDRLVASFDEVLAEINSPILEGESEETDQDDHPDHFQVGETVVSWRGREGVVEAINLIEDFPITVRHSVREQVSYKLGGVKKKGDDHTGVKPQPDPPKPSKDQPPSGYRLLGDAKAEPRIEGDSYWSVGAKGWYPLIEELLRFANDENWAACRKIEDSPKRYREPTQADLANGQIECEVRDLDGEPWKAGLLSSIYDSASLRFEGKTKVGIQERWEQCRIEVQE